MSQSKLLFIGDIVGSYGRKICAELLPDLLKELSPDFIIANGENAAHGNGLTLKVYDLLMELGIDALTSGNHLFDKKEFIKDLGNCPNLVRPANYPPGVPGKEYLVIEKTGKKLAVFNLLGRTFMPPFDDPFRAADRIIAKIRDEADLILLDMHAEATSEKTAIGNYLDGQVNAVIGTHTHVMTADERLLPNGTAYITDVGMVGAQDSIIGMQKEPILKRFLTGLHAKFEPSDTGPGIFNAVLITIENNGRVQKIERINLVHNFS